jgi:ABC transporter with metal-binding/Fe-S-binding domain ATP-binding protein
MRVVCLFSGGKDSTFAAFYALFQGWDVALLTVISEKDSPMFHHPNVELCGEQAKCMGLPIRMVKTTKERELSDLRDALADMDIDGVVTGGIESEYQKQRIDGIANEIGVRSFSPLWRKGDVLLNETVNNFEVYITAVSAEGLDSSLLGARFDKKFLERMEKLPTQLNRFFEGGEGETFVADAPFFSKRISILEWKKEWEKTRGTAKITKIKKEKKV